MCFLVSVVGQYDYVQLDKETRKVSGLGLHDAKRRLREATNKYEEFSRLFGSPRIYSDLYNGTTKTAKYYVGGFTYEDLQSYAVVYAYMVSFLIGETSYREIVGEGALDELLRVTENSNALAHSTYLYIKGGLNSKDLQRRSGILSEVPYFNILLYQAFTSYACATGRPISHLEGLRIFLACTYRIGFWSSVQFVHNNLFTFGERIAGSLAYVYTNYAAFTLRQLIMASPKAEILSSGPGKIMIKVLGLNLSNAFFIIAGVKIDRMVKAPTTENTWITTGAHRQFALPSLRLYVIDEDFNALTFTPFTAPTGSSKGESTVLVKSDILFSTSLGVDEIIINQIAGEVSAIELFDYKSGTLNKVYQPKVEPPTTYFIKTSPCWIVMYEKKVAGGVSLGVGWPNAGANESNIRAIVKEESLAVMQKNFEVEFNKVYTNRFKKDVMGMLKDPDFSAGIKELRANIGKTAAVTSGLFNPASGVLRNISDLQDLTNEQQKLLNAHTKTISDILVTLQVLKDTKIDTKILDEILEVKMLKLIKENNLMKLDEMQRYVSHEEVRNLVSAAVAGADIEKTVQNVFNSSESRFVTVGALRNALNIYTTESELRKVVEGFNEIYVSKLDQVTQDERIATIISNLKNDMIKRIDQVSLKVASEKLLNSRLKVLEERIGASPIVTAVETDGASAGPIHEAMLKMTTSTVPGYENEPKKFSPYHNPLFFLYSTLLVKGRGTNYYLSKLNRSTYMKSMGDILIGEKSGVVRIGSALVTVSSITFIRDVDARFVKCMLTLRYKHEPVLEVPGMILKTEDRFHEHIMSLYEVNGNVPAGYKCDSVLFVGSESVL